MSFSIMIALFSDWVKPQCNKDIPLSPGESVHFLTTNNEKEKYIEVFYTLSGGSSNRRGFVMRCEDEVTNLWSYRVSNCTANSYNKQFLKNVPDDNFKHWIINKTSTHLEVVCNKVSVLSFNFATDSDRDKKDGSRVWSRQIESFQLNHQNYRSLLIRSD